MLNGYRKFGGFVIFDCTCFSTRAFFSEHVTRIYPCMKHAAKRDIWADSQREDTHELREYMGH